MALNSHETFEKMIVLNATAFAEVAAKNINAMLDINSTTIPARFSEDGVVSKNNFFVSIMFTGMVFGEYILALNTELAAQLIGKTFDGLSEEQKTELLQEISDYFCEILNLSVGDCIRGLSQTYQKLTITAPRVYIGQIKYPKVKTGLSTLETENGEIECFLFVDEMKLDIADSYKTALLSVTKTNRELKAAYQQLQEQQLHLVQTEKYAALGTMAAGVAHEINTPLSVILLNESIMQDLLLEEDLNREKFSRMLKKIEDTVTKISKITQTLRAYAVDNSAATTESEFKPVSVNDIIDSALLLCENWLQQNSIQLTAFKISETVQIECRAQQLSQIIYNLILNASDAIKDLPEKWIRIDIEDAGDQVVMSVTDSGPGIPLAHRDKIFDPFYTTKAVGQGMGLGLSLSKGIIDIHQGKISYDPNSKNTKFIIVLPKIRNQNESAA